MLLINDTNIWIDLKYVGLVEEVFKLPFEIGVPDILFEEELRDTDGELLIRNKLKIIQMTPEEISETGNLLNNTTGVSFNDLTTLVLSSKRNYILVTGDKNLRNLAEKRNVTLRGSIWILDQLVEKSIISKTRGIEVCKKFLDSSRRLPKIELRRRIKIWED